MSQINSPNQTSGSVPVSRQNSNNNANSRRSNRLTPHEIDNVAKLSLTIDEKLVQSFSQNYCNYFNALIDKTTEESSLDSLKFIQLQLLEHFNQFKVATSSYLKELEIMEMDEAELEKEIEAAKKEKLELEEELKVENDGFSRRKGYDSLVGEISKLPQTHTNDQLVTKLQEEIKEMNDKISIKQENFNYLKDFFQQIVVLIHAAKDGINKMQKDSSFKLQESEALSPMLSNADAMGSNAPNSPLASNSEANALEDTTSPIASTNEVSTPQSTTSKKHTREDEESQLEEAAKRLKGEGTERSDKKDANDSDLIENTSEAANVEDEDQAASNTVEEPSEELED